MPVIKLSDLVRRITAPNPGRMTGNGTNTYLVGNEKVAVIDPGPPIDSHINEILGACGDRLKWILVTHTHPDHSPAASMLAERSGAQLLGCVMPDDGHQDMSFTVKQNIQHGELLSSSEFVLEAIHTPGHVANHYCYFLHQDGLLFSGDHIMNGSSVVIIPPAGDMAHYLQSTELLAGFPITAIAPGHGDVMDNPERVLKNIVRHRMIREKKIMRILREMEQASLDQLLPPVYDDVDPALHRMAKLSLWAHVLKLEHEGQIKKRIVGHWAFGEELWVPSTR
ncbi:MAG: MBL fold metallo-hydrolase [Pseudomonadales bacterium]|nr:MBL fold metallo-hydrolase [Pseudomonadales bacterium]